VKDLEEQLLSCPAQKQWRQIGVKHHHGIDISLAALHSSDSGGIGEYTDLIPMIDWCHEIGFDVLQLLPINDSDTDPSPYSALSAFALHPIYMALRDLPYAKEDKLFQDDLVSLQELQGGRRVRYQQVRKRKDEVMRAYLHRHGQKILGLDDYLYFMESNPWLKAYTLFKALKQLNGGRNWMDWNVSYEEVESSDTSAFAKEIEFHSLIQFFCFQQMHKVKEYAEQKGVFIKGDIPILVNKDSAEVWSEPSLFFCDVEAGAPPDMYEENGQNWGFPTYNWEARGHSGYNWWRQRLDIAEKIYSLYRLDHVVGFYRIWTIDKGKKTSEGYFDPKDESKWLPQGDKILRMMIEHSAMLPIAEDLGTVPDDVRKNLEELGICGTKVMRWERNWGTDQKYIDPKEYNPISMTTVSTHDSPTIEQWWRDYKDDGIAFSEKMEWNYEENLSKEQHSEILKESHESASLFHINLLQEYFPLVPFMTWPNIDDERINVPGTVNETNWTYRYRPSVEKIVANEELKEIMKGYSKKESKPSM
jgi:4-alpha-glucanotransferase